MEEVERACREENLEINDENAKIIPNIKMMSKTVYSIRNAQKPSEPTDTDDLDLSDDR